MEVLRDDVSGSSLLALLTDLLVDKVRDLDTELRGGTMIFGDRTPSADCHAIVSGLPLYIDPSDTAWTWQWRSEWVSRFLMAHQHN